jgi:hydrogenase maturation protease
MIVRSHTPSSAPTRVLILARGDTHCGDDGIGPALAGWVTERFQTAPSVRVILCCQWTPELAQEIATSEAVLFIDCSTTAKPGSVNLLPVEPGARCEAPATHYLGASEMMRLALDVYGCAPGEPLLLLIGARSTELGDRITPEVLDSLRIAVPLLESIVLRLLSE